ncbi:unnamed protein product [Sphagnum tenellum]
MSKLATRRRTKTVLGLMVQTRNFADRLPLAVLQYGNLTPNQARAIARSLVKYAGQLEEAYTDTCDAPEEVVAKSMSAAVSANEAPMLDWGGFQVA